MPVELCFTSIVRSVPGTIVPLGLAMVQGDPTVQVACVKTSWKVLLLAKTGVNVEVLMVTVEGVTAFE